MKIYTNGNLSNEVYYQDNIEIRNNDVIVNHSNGRIVYENGSGDGEYQYYLKDHLGNVRLTFAKCSEVQLASCKNDDIVVINENHYYPFGMKMKGDWNSNNTANPEVTNQYNGKEWVDDLGLGMNDYGARWYDPAVARWNSVDPLAEKYVGHSPYNYVLGNPVKYIDPDGRETVIYNLNGAYQFTIPDNLPDESHFLSNSAIADLASQCCVDANEEGVYARSISNYFIGSNTMNKIKGISNLSIAENKERGFVFYLTGKGKELDIFDLTTSDIDRGERWFSMGDALAINLPSAISPLGTGHTHPNFPYASEPEKGVSWFDYTPNLKNNFTNRFGGNPFFIAHKSGIKVYSSAQRKENPNFFAPSYFHYEYVGSWGEKPTIKY